MDAELPKPILLSETGNRYRLHPEGYVVNLKTGNKLYGNPRNGYLSFSLRLRGEGRSTRVQIHRLIGKYYVPNPNNYPVAMHIDDVRTNNHYKNIKWGTYEMNTRDMVEKGRHNNQYTKKTKYSCHGRCQ